MVWRCALCQNADVPNVGYCTAWDRGRLPRHHFPGAGWIRRMSRNGLNRPSVRRRSDTIFGPAGLGYCVCETTQVTGTRSKHPADSRLTVLVSQVVVYPQQDPASRANTNERYEHSVQLPRFTGLFRGPTQINLRLLAGRTDRRALRTLRLFQAQSLSILCQHLFTGGECSQTAVPFRSLVMAPTERQNTFKRCGHARQGGTQTQRRR